MNPPELSRRIQLRSLRSTEPAATRAPVTYETLVEATSSELRAVARRLDLPAASAIRCRFRLAAPDPAGRVAADGLLEAEVTRNCVVTLEDFPVRIVEAFEVRFVPERHPATDFADGARIAAFHREPDLLDPEEDDEIPYSDGLIDLGEATVEQLALALDPYPRRPGAELPAGIVTGDPPSPDHPPGPSVGDAGGTGDDRPNPFAALARIRRGDG